MSRMAAWLILAANLLFLFATLPLLPETVAIHFDADGHPDNWMTRGAHAVFMASFVIFMMGVFMLMPALMERVPARLISVPRHSYWTAPEQRPQLHTLLRQWCLQMAAVTGLFMLLVQVLTVMANRSLPVRLDSTALVLSMVLFIAATLVLVVRLVRRLRTPG